MGIVLSLIGVIMCCMAISEISKQKKQQNALTKEIDQLQDKLRAIEEIPNFEEFCRSEEASGVQ